jgi:hypothetical protein
MRGGGYTLNVTGSREVGQALQGRGCATRDQPSPADGPVAPAGPVPNVGLPPVVLTRGDQPAAALNRRLETRWLRLNTAAISRPEIICVTTHGSA